MEGGAVGGGGGNQGGIDKTVLPRPPALHNLHCSPQNALVSTDPLLSTTCSALNKMHWSPQTLCSPQLAVCSTKCTSLSALHPMLCSSPKHPTVSSAQPLHCLSKDPSVQCISPIHCECKELCPDCTVTHNAHTCQSARQVQSPAHLYGC